MGKRIVLIVFAIVACMIDVQAVSRSVTYTFNSKHWNATDEAGNVADWISGKAGSSYISGQGVRVLTSESGAKATSPIAFENVESVVVRYCTNSSSGKGTINITIGDNEVMTFSVKAPSKNGNTLKDAEMVPATPESGSVVLKVNCTQNSVYIYSVTVNYEDVDGVYEPEFSVAPGIYDEAQRLTFGNVADGTTVRYTRDASVDLKGSNGYSVWDGVSEIPVTLTQTIRAIATDGTNFSNEVVAEYVLKAESPVITAAVDSKGNYYTETLDVTISSKYTDFNKLIVECSVTEGETTRDVAVTSNPFTFEMSGTATVCAKVAYNADGAILEPSDVCEVTFTQQDATAVKGIFARVNSADAIAVGDEVLIVSEKGGMVMGVSTNDGKKRTGVAEDVNGTCRLAESSVASVYELKEGSVYGEYYMFDPVSGEYVDLSSTSSTTLGIGKNDVSITFEGNNAIIKNDRNASRLVLWSASAEVFGNYSEVNYDANDAASDYYCVELYRKLTGDDVTATIECEEGTENLRDGHTYEGAKNVILTSEGSSSYCLIHDGELSNVLFSNNAVIDVSAEGDYTIAMPNALYAFEVTANSDDPSIPTGLAYQASETKAVVYGAEGAVVVTGVNGFVKIFDATGRLVKAENAMGRAELYLPKGYYIVRANGVSQSVIVR